MTRRLFLTVLLLLLCLGGVYAGVKILPRLQSYKERREREQVVLPPPVKLVLPVSSVSAPSSLSGSLSSVSFSSSSSKEPLTAVNWDVPFTPQAPFAVWDPLHEEACEEASILMVLRYFRGEGIASPGDAETAIQFLVMRSGELGFTVDLTAVQARLLLLDQDPSLTVELLRNPTVDQLKDALAGGALIVVPAAGRELRNPYFQRPGPLYHMLVLRGFTADGHVITNDPGTKRGKEFVYTWERLLAAMHDWNNGNVANGEQVVLIVNH